MNIREMFNGSPKFLLAQDFIELDLKTPPFLIYPFLPTGGTGMIFGRGGSGKTQLALTMAAAIMDGTFFLSKFKARKGRVVLVEVDTPPLIMQGRLQKLVKHSSLKDLGLVMYDSSIDIVEESQKAKAAKRRPEWAETLVSTKPDLIIVDSLRTTHSMDENDSRVPSAVISAWRHLVGSGAALLFIHHARKMPMEFMGSSDEDGARGTGAWRDAVDFQMQMVQKKDNNRLVEWTKVRTCEERDVPAMAVMIEPESLTVELQDKAMSRAVELAGVSLDRKEIVQRLVVEGLCKQSVAYEKADHALQLFADNLQAYSE